MGREDFMGSRSLLLILSLFFGLSAQNKNSNEGTKTIPSTKSDQIKIVEGCGIAYKTGYETIDIAPNATVTLQTKEIELPDNGNLIINATANILNQGKENADVVFKILIDSNEVGIPFIQTVNQKNFETATMICGAFNLSMGKHTITFTCQNSSNSQVSNHNGTAISYSFSRNSL